MAKSNDQYRVKLENGSLDQVSEDTFKRFQEVMSSMLKESGATTINITLDDDKARALMVDQVVGP
ncbi:MAG: hypothetical protein K5821_16400 [Nitrobacter sp.]|uniref:hypothetical protein n=1 Tax=Nitrobacter sp. TaxID=29420 RepID=UPI00261667D7|nr:hypothetical protein [Nitrobacter sp.]MCV0387942.1 hypothetical protein [Nitrobacter sp.]